MLTLLLVLFSTLFRGGGFAAFLDKRGQELQNSRRDSTLPNVYASYLFKDGCELVSRKSARTAPDPSDHPPPVGMFIGKPNYAQN